MNNWHIESSLPDSEPNLSNLHIYFSPTLISGASPDANFIFDAVYAVEKECFVLTMMKINNEWGFIEHQAYRYPATRSELLEEIRRFQEDPEAVWNAPAC